MLKPFHRMRTNLQILLQDVCPFWVIVLQVEESADGAFIRTLCENDAITFVKCLDRCRHGGLLCVETEHDLPSFLARDIRDGQFSGPNNSFAARLLVGDATLIIPLSEPSLLLFVSERPSLGSSERFRFQQIPPWFRYRRLWP